LAPPHPAGDGSVFLGAAVKGQKLEIFGPVTCCLGRGAL
jgi:hypothetical protein